MANGSGGGEHRVQIPAHGAAGSAGKGDAAPEKHLNGFVHAVALVERLGNALGTLAFTWATVVLLGGYPTVLGPDDDFVFATAIVFLEATRMFSRNNRLDYQLFFNTRGAFRPPGWNGLVLIVCFSSVLDILTICFWLYKMEMYLSMAIQLVIGRFLSELCPRIPRLVKCNLLWRTTSLWGPVAAVALRALSTVLSIRLDNNRIYIWLTNESIAAFMSYLVLSVVVLLLAISRLRFPVIIKLVDTTLGSKAVVWHQVTLNLCMFAALMVSVITTVRSSYPSDLVFTTEAYALVIVSFGNLQIPAAVVRVVLALLRLTARDNFHDDHHEPEKQNIVPSLEIFYRMVLGQGLLYLLACAIELFSFIPRRSLVHSSGLRGHWGVESVNMYYAYTLENRMQGGVLAPNNIRLSNFVMDSVNSDSSKKQLYGIRMMHCFLQREPINEQLLSKFTTSTKTMSRIIRMLDWKSSNDTAIRLYAAKVTAELAKNIHVVSFPGTIQLVSALLDTSGRPKRGNPLLDTDDVQDGRQDPFLNTEESQKQGHDAVRDAADNLLDTQTSSTQQVGIDKQSSCILRCWQRISEFWSIPREELLLDHDLQPALAMSIIDNLAGCDQDNCLEISKSTDLIPKIIGFTCYRTDTTITQAQQEFILKSSLKVLRRLTGIGGETGITLRYKISKHPFILSNLAEILGDNRSSQESRKLVAGILRNIAIDENTRQEIGHVQLIITRLVQEFLNAEGTMSSNAGHLSRKAAGQALTMLTIESAHNCLVMLKAPDFMKELKTMILIHDGNYIYVAASLLRNLCLHAQHELRESDLKELSHTLREVLERITDVEGAELETLIGLSSQICKIIPGHFTRELEDSQIKQRFARKLVDTLNANMKPSADYPGIRRVILEQVIHLMECNSRYADCFSEFNITEALSRVERTVTKAESYRLFLGDEGFMKYSVPLSDLVTRARELMG
ncbi:uncharacterized protein LOC123424990 [Hordeum vulgare subsp. vulgare]|uniref:uncharacterized protein LOC123424990 n=1 Tax=Hordeum vulgare subsp. vulgare TaxID=112509 RepID=UPI001D1A48C6|nr:uncharacterized protein LOC123424990 [Hordeum vulgare subsp. vulgare]